LKQAQQGEDERQKAVEEAGAEVRRQHDEAAAAAGRMAAAARVALQKAQVGHKDGCWLVIMMDVGGYK